MGVVAQICLSIQLVCNSGVGPTMYISALLVEAKSNFHPDQITYQVENN